MSSYGYNINNPKELYIVVNANGDVHCGGWKTGPGPKLYSKGIASRIANIHNNKIDKYAVPFDADGKLQAQIGTKVPYSWSREATYEYTQRHYDIAKSNYEYYQRSFPESSRKMIRHAKINVLADPLEAAIKNYILNYSSAGSPDVAVDTVVKDLMNIITKTK